MINYLSDSCGDPAGFYVQGHISFEDFWKVVEQESETYQDYHTDESLKKVIRHAHALYGEEDKWGNISMVIGPVGEPITVVRFVEAENI